MPFQFNALETGTHEQLTSTATADIVTATQPSGDARGFYVTVLTTSCYLTWDGTDPSATNGVIIPAAAAPVFIACGSAAPRVAATATANSVVNIGWVA